MKSWWKILEALSFLNGSVACWLKHITANMNLDSNPCCKLYSDQRTPVSVPSSAVLPLSHGISTKASWQKAFFYVDDWKQTEVVLQYSKSSIACLKLMVYVGTMLFILTWQFKSNGEENCWHHVRLKAVAPGTPLGTVFFTVINSH